MSRPFAAHEWMLAARYLGARRRRDVISVIAGFSFAGIALGVATLIIVMAVMNGLRSDLLSRLLGADGHAVIRAADGQSGIVDAADVVGRLLAVPGVTRAVPMIKAQVMLSLRGESVGALLTGIAAADLRRLPSVSHGMRAGNLDLFDEPGAIITGRRLAARLGARLGDRITVLSLKSQSGKGGAVIPRAAWFQLVAIVDLGDPNLDGTTVYMPLAAAETYFGGMERVQEIELMVSDPERIDAMKAELERAAGPGLKVSTWREDNAALVSAVFIERDVTFLILALIILVAALNIVSGLIMLVKDKSSDIGVLRTLGMTSGSVMRIFFLAGASIGVAGTLAGFIVGVVFCLEIEPIRLALSELSGTARFDPEVNFLLTLPARMESGEVVAVVAMALALSFLATLYPAYRAASLDPVEALRYE